MSAVSIDVPFDLRGTWQRAKLPLVVAGVFIVTALVTAVLAAAPVRRPLDPRDAAPGGARALAVLVRAAGVDVTEVADAGTVVPNPSTTVFVPDPTSLTRAQLRRLATGPGDLVVVGATDRELGALGVRASTTGAVTDTTTAPDCGFAPARVAGRVRYAGVVYAASAAGCYADGGDAGAVVTQRVGGTTVVFGSVPTLSNAWLPDEGDAALGLGLLTRQPRLAWVLPQPPTHRPADQPTTSIGRLLPARLLWALLAGVLAVGWFAGWRARRLGPVVVEPLPVVVRAVETVEGRARLWRAARARDSAADALRRATVARLAQLLRVGADAGRGAVVDAVARRTGRAAAEVDALLYGAQPADDAALVRLPESLDELEQQVRSS